MKQEQIERINELYRKSKAEGLTEAEKKEQELCADSLLRMCGGILSRS